MQTLCRPIYIMLLDEKDVKRRKLGLYVAARHTYAWPSCLGLYTALHACEHTYVTVNDIIQLCRILHLYIRSMRRARFMNERSRDCRGASHRAYSYWPVFPVHGGPKIGSASFVRINFIKYWPIFEIVALSESRENWQIMPSLKIPPHLKCVDLVKCHSVGQTVTAFRWSSHWSVTSPAWKRHPAARRTH